MPRPDTEPAHQIVYSARRSGLQVRAAAKAIPTSAAYPDNPHMKTNTALATMRAGKPAFGLSMGLGVPETGAILSGSGTEFVMVDRQHGNWDERDVGRAIAQINLGAATPMARVATNDYRLIGQLLDKGMLGIIVPMVDTPEDARRVADACLLPPLGRRSWGWNQAGMYGDDYADRINDELFVAVQLESVTAVDNAEAILATPGITGCWTGPSDLALSLGFHPSEMDTRDEHRLALERVLAACRDTGKIPGIAGRGLEDARRRRLQGFQFITVTSDAALIAQGASAARSSLDNL